MLALLADANIELHVGILVDQCRGPRWRLVWDALGLTAYRFSDIGLASNTPDNVLWRLCQQREILLVTANRNASGPESLQGDHRPGGEGA